MILKKQLSLLAIAILSVFTYSCKDDDEPMGDTTDPIITLTSPQDGAVINTPGTVTISGTIVEAGELERITVVISAGLFSISEESLKGDADFPTKAGDTYTINVSQDAPEGYEGNYEINIEAEDAAGNIGTESISITLE